MGLGSTGAVGRGLWREGCGVSLWRCGEGSWKLLPVRQCQELRVLGRGGSWSCGDLGRAEECGEVGFGQCWGFPAQGPGLGAVGKGNQAVGQCTGLRGWGGKLWGWGKGSWCQGGLWGSGSG